MDRAGQVYRRTLAIAAFFLGCWQTVQASELDQAIQLIQNRDWKKAEAALEQLPSNDFSTLYWKAFLNLRTGRYKRSIALATAGLEQKPDSAAARKVLGLSYFMEGQTAQAESQLHQATELDPKDQEALYYLGRLLFTRSNFPEALDTFRRVITLDPISLRGFNQLGQTLEALSRFDDAESAYQKAIDLEKIQPVKSEWPWFNLGVLKLRQGKASEAVDLLRQAVLRAPSWPEGKIKLASAYMAIEKSSEARSLLEQVLTTDPANADAHYQLGRLLMKMGEQEQARVHLRQFESLRKHP